MADLPSIDPKRMAGWMGVTLYIGGAIKVASAQQRDRLKHEVQPMLADTDVPVRDVLDRVNEIMGPDWELPPDFDTMIKSLLS